jgi:hypothetical protein
MGKATMEFLIRNAGRQERECIGYFFGFASFLDDFDWGGDLRCAPIPAFVI